MVICVIVPQPGANHIEIADEAYNRIEQLKKDLPEDVSIEMIYDNTRFIRASIYEVEETIYVALALVVLIIFLFLRDWRVTLVPCVVIPVSLGRRLLRDVYLRLLHQRIDHVGSRTLSRPGGRRRDRGGREYICPYRTRDESERGGYRRFEGNLFAVISTTVTLVSVFLPIVFMEGMTGRLFKEFSIVIAGSVTISSFCRPDLHADACHQITAQAGKKKLAVCKDRTFFLKG